MLMYMYQRSYTKTFFLSWIKHLMVLIDRGHSVQFIVLRDLGIVYIYRYVICYMIKFVCKLCKILTVGECYGSLFNKLITMAL